MGQPMKASLENLLSDSLAGLRDLSGQTGAAVEEPGPVESLGTITAEQISAEVLEHVQDERYNNTDNCRQVCEDFMERNEEEHAALRRDIAEVTETVQHITAAMEMASTVCSMESLSEGDLNVVNTALANIAAQAGDIDPPTLVAEDGQLTSVSMEGLGDFLKNLLTRLKKWIKEKFENMAIAFRRDNMNRAVLNKRLAAVMDRISRLPEDYGIPAKALRIDPNYSSCMYFGDKALDMTAPAIKGAGDKTIALMKRAINEIHNDAIKRSDAIGDVIAAVLVTRDSIQAEETLRKLFKDVTADLPARAINKNLGEISGMAFYDGYTGYRSRYRDVEWILELVNLIEAPAVSSKLRRNGRVGESYVDVKQLSEIGDVIGGLLNDPVSLDNEYFNALCHAWNDAHDVYSRLWEMVTSMTFPQMNNELWRAFDIATSAMFSFLDKAYYSVAHLRAPYFRLVDGTLYILEEQMKGYVAVNR